MKYIRRAICVYLMCTFGAVHSSAQADGTTKPLSASPDGESKKAGDWEIVETSKGVKFFSQEFSVIPQPEPTPALRFRFIDDPMERNNRNAAIFYLRAIGFLDEEQNRNAMNEFWRQAWEEAKQKKLALAAPARWPDMNPKDLPIEEVRKYVALTEFQVRELREARKCKSLDFERHLNELSSPAMLLLPESMQFRNIARNQAVRCRLAIAENRIDDAIEVLSQQFSMAQHFGQDDVFVANLTGIAVASMAADGAFKLIEHEKCPNLYWAYASLPKPLVSYENGLGFEGRFLLKQVENLNVVDTDARDEAFWSTTIEKLAKTLVEGQVDPWGSLEPTDAVEKVGSIVWESQEAASKYLSAKMGMNSEQLSSMDPRHIAMLSLVTYYRERTDQLLKWSKIPYWQLRQNASYIRFVNQENSDVAIGKLTAICNCFIAPSSIYKTQAEIERKIAILQTIEALRMYASENNDALPMTLAETPMPAAIDPMTGKDFDYSHDGKQFDLVAPAFEGVLGFRIKVHVKPQ